MSIGTVDTIGLADPGAITTGTVVARWNNAALDAIRETHPGPPIVARALAILHTCIYDAWVAYDSSAVGTRLGRFLRRPVDERSDDNKIEALSYAAYRALVDLFPRDRFPAGATPLYDTLMTDLGFDPTDTGTDLTTPRGIGNVASHAVLTFRHGDGANQLGDLHPGPYSDYTGYAPVNTPDAINDPDHWQPLRVPTAAGPPVVQTYIAPHWGLVTPFALTSGAQFRPATGPEVAAANEYRVQAEQILEYSAALTDEQKVIAEYWADGPASELPPGHWCLFAQFVSRRDGHDLDTDVKLFFALTNAIFDASIACWEAKRAFDSVRPVTAIHYLFEGETITAWKGPYQGTGPLSGEDWRPYQAATVVTPPFPEYVSGHSTFSTAGAEILKQFTGSDDFGGTHTQLAGTSRVEPQPASGEPSVPYFVPATDVTLFWATFSDGADQAGISRRYGGIHFVEGDLVGRTTGRAIAMQAWTKAQGFILGAPGA